MAFVTACLSACASDPVDATGKSASSAPLPAAPSAVVSVSGAAAPIAPNGTTANPLGLPADARRFAVGTKVFAPPSTMMRPLALGGSLALRSTTVVGEDENGLVVDGRDGPDYVVHPSYLVPFEPGLRPKPDQPVLAEWAGALRHGVARRIVRDRVVVRFTDTADRRERTLALDQIAPWSEGFVPGGMAATRAGGHDHVLLVSRTGEGPSAEWLCLGWAGTTHRLREELLVPLPTKFQPKVGDRVWAEHVGRMRPGTVHEVDPPGVFRVKFERAGKLVEVGLGQLMPPLDP